MPVSGNILGKFDVSVVTVGFCSIEYIIFCGYNINQAGGKMTSGIAIWSDTGVPVMAVQPPATLSVPQGGIAVVPARVSAEFTQDFNHPLSYQWYRDGSGAVSDGVGGAGGTGTVSGATTDTLVITGFSDSDRGIYYLQVTNHCGASVTMTDVSLALAACIADFNGVGGVTVQDIFDFLDGWFSGCSV